jgi:hypothetical protein
MVNCRELSAGRHCSYWGLTNPAIYCCKTGCEIQNEDERGLPRLGERV